MRAVTDLRPLTPEEEKLLRWVLEHGTDEAKSYLPQIEGMRAKTSCSCGCPSIVLVVSDDAPAAIAAKERIVVDLSGQTAEGISVGVLLFQDDGKLSELEIYPYGDEGKFGLPTIKSLSPFEADKPVSSKS
jgi:hypothetical protein